MKEKTPAPPNPQVSQDALVDGWIPESGNGQKSSSPRERTNQETSVELEQWENQLQEGWHKPKP